MTPAGTPSGYRRRPGDQRLLEALLVGGTPTEAAERAGLSRRTVYRRLSHPGFLAELRAQQRDVLAQLRRRTVALSAQALDALHDVVVDETAPAAARVSAARCILDRADPVPARFEVAAAVPHPGDQSPTEQLDDALRRARERLGVDQPAYSGKGRSNGD